MAEKKAPSKTSSQGVMTRPSSEMAKPEESTERKEQRRKEDKPSGKSGGRYTAVRRPLRHPYTGALYQPGRVTEALELDNWLKSQIQAGLIKEA